MSDTRPIRSALISVFHKEGLEPIVEALKQLNVTIYSTGGTQAAIEAMGAEVVPVESITDYPSILGGRVKTLHPKVFGGILGRRGHESDMRQMEEYALPAIDLVVVDLYPFEATVASGASEAEIVEKIDIGGIALIRGAAKNFQDVVVVPSMNDYGTLTEILQHGGETTLAQRKALAARGFRVSSHYDTMIHAHMSGQRLESGDVDCLNLSVPHAQGLRYGENPHQPAKFFGHLDALLKPLHGKALSYNNLLDVDAAVQLMEEFQDDDPTFAILKHNNTCGCDTRTTLVQAYVDALAGDPTSAFGGVLIANRTMDVETAKKVHELFCEVVIAPGFDADAFEVLAQKKNRILLERQAGALPAATVRSALNGYLVQQRDVAMEGSDTWTCTTTQARPDSADDLLFALKLVKHTKSNTIVFAKDGQLLASGTGQTSRVDACRQAIEKAQSFGFDLKGASMASDAFFPFPDCVEMAAEAGVVAVIQPGGSINDQKSIDACNNLGMAMYTTGIRHFKH
jgi:phosphoribosylaminoimidazolecarboxamide formyltransferase/IMP cyclohydrolase